MLEHETEIRVRYVETDQGGVVYHANYLNYFEVGRTELLRAAGFPYRRFEEEGYFLAVTRCDLRYLSPARYDDLIRVRTRLISGSSVRFRIGTEIDRPADERAVASGEVELACIDGQGRPRPIPNEFKAIFPADFWRKRR